MFRKLAVLFLALGSFGLLAVPNALAQQALMVFHTKVPLAIPGKVLTPGTYTLLNVNPRTNVTGGIAIQNAKGVTVGEYVTQPVRLASVTGKSIVKTEKQAHGPARIEELIPGNGSFGYKLMYNHPITKPEGTAVSKSVPLDKINGVKR